MDAWTAEARARISGGEFRGALDLLELAVWHSVQAKDAAGLGDAELLLAELREAVPRTDHRVRRRCSYLATIVKLNLPIVTRQAAAAPPAPPPPPEPAPPAGAAATGELGRRLDGLEARLADLARELAEVRALAATAAPGPEREAVRAPQAPVAPPVAPPVADTPAGEAPAPAAAPAPRPAPPPESPPRPPPAAPAAPAWTSEPRRAPRRPLPELLGARTLAWAGGLVTLLGIAFLFVLAVNRGWIGPEVRLAVGAAVSVAVYAAGFLAHRRYGVLYATMAATAVGMAGGYATLVAASVLYGFVPEPAALVAAAGIAGVGVATSLVLATEAFAALGLVGAMVAPLVVQQDLTVLGGSFLAIVFAAAAVAAIWRRWRVTLALAAAVGAVQAFAAVVVDAGAEERWRALALAGAFWFLFVASGVAFQLREGTRRLAPLTAPLVLGGVSLAFFAAARLLEGEALGVRREGLGLLAVAVVHCAAGAAVFRDPRFRVLASLVWGTGLTVASVAFAELLSGPRLTAVWAGDAVLLAWLGLRARELRLHLGGFVYLLLAVGEALVVEAPPSDLFTASAHPAGGAASVAIAAAAAALFARLAWRSRQRRPAGGGRLRGAVVATLAAYRAHQLLLRAAAACAAAVLLLYALSLSVLELAVWAGRDTIAADFERGHVGVSGLWAAVALGLLLAGILARRASLEWAAAALYLVSLAEVVGYDRLELPRTLWALSFLILGASLLAGGSVRQHVETRPGRLAVENAVAVLLSLALMWTAVVALVDGTFAGADLEGAALLGLGAVYGGLAAAVFPGRREREHATLLWSIGLVLTAVSIGQMLELRLSVLVWSAAGAGLAWLARRLEEGRFQTAGLAYLLVALGGAGWDAPPRDLFVSSRHPAAGVPSVVFLAAGVAIFALACRPEDVSKAAGGPPDPLARPARRLGSRQALWRSLGLWTAAGLVVYAGSLSILELSETLSPEQVSESFQRGHAGVSGFWGLIGLVLLSAGVVRQSPPLRLAGFAIFGASLGKLFLYDLSNLSSMTRALSFLAVGMLLLLAGFFYQRLSHRPGEPRSRGPGGPAMPPG